MAYNDSQHSNETARSHCDSEEDSMDKCDTTLDASQESNLSRRGSDIRNHLTRSPFEDPRRNSSPHESYIQDIPLDFSMPKRKGFDSLSNSPKHEVHSPFLTSSPPPQLLISGRNSSGMYNESARTNGCVSPADMPPECRLQSPCDNKPEAMPNPLLNGQFIEAGAIPTEFYLRERSHSLSSSLQKQRQRGGGIPQGSPRGVWRGGGPIRSHHGNDPTLISALAANAVGYPELISPHPTGCASPILGSVQSEELLSVQMYKDHMQQLGVDNHHYTFLPSTIPSCVTDSVSRNSIISSLPNMLPPSIPSPTGRHPTPTATATASTNSISSSITPPSPSSISSTSSSCTITTPAKRRPRSLPDNQKDDAYWERRRKNNEAAKRSRDARRLKEEEIALRASFLEQENVKLKCEVASLKTETAKLKCLLFNN